MEVRDFDLIWRTVSRNGLKDSRINAAFRIGRLRGAFRCRLDEEMQAVQSDLNAFMQRQRMMT
eukprot:9358783-Prorocentrum_lima.AAC.1